jgi:hypothetical protein
MLNRKTSNYLFYGSLLLILAVVVLIRTVAVSSLNAGIEDVTLDNRTIQNQIDALEEIVQDNKDIQIDHLYDLYGQVPNIYNKTELTFYTIAQLELVGITENPETLRAVTVDDTVTFPVDTEFDDLQDDFLVVEVEVYFNTLSVDVVDEFIDLLYQSEQVFIVNSIEYYSPDGTNYIGVTVNFLAFYDVE